MLIEIHSPVAGKKSKTFLLIRCQDDNLCFQIDQKTHTWYRILSTCFLTGCQNPFIGCRKVKNMKKFITMRHDRQQTLRDVLNLIIINNHREDYRSCARPFYSLVQIIPKALHSD